MRMLKVVEMRKSVREYKMVDFDKDILDKIVNLSKSIPKINEDVDIEFRFIVNGGEIASKLEGFAGYYGKMIKAPHYFAIYSKNDVENYKYAGYAGEWLILNAAKLEVGSCWIEPGKDPSKTKELLGYETDKELVALIAMGWPSGESNVSNIYGSKERVSMSALTEGGYPNFSGGLEKGKLSPRVSISEIVFSDKWNNSVEFEELKNQGLDEVFYYMRLAPSWGNRQPWKFILSGEKIILAVKKNEEITENVANIDAGIAMLYFEVAMHNYGISGKWEIGNAVNPENYNIPEDYFVVGYYSN